MSNIYIPKLREGSEFEMGGGTGEKFWTCREGGGEETWACHEGWGAKNFKCIAKNFKHIAKILDLTSDSEPFQDHQMVLKVIIRFQSFSLTQVGS